MYNSTVYYDLKHSIYRNGQSINIITEKIRLVFHANLPCPFSSPLGFSFISSSQLYIVKCVHGICYISIDCIHRLYPYIVSIDCIQRLYPEIVPRDCIQILYPEIVSRDCIQRLYPEIVPRDCIQRLYQIQIISDLLFRLE